MTARDLVYGRRGGGWSDSSGIVDGPPCEVCRGPMLGGQRRRHGVCSPRLDCCGAYEDLLGSTIAKHQAAHREVDAERTTRRGRR